MHQTIPPACHFVASGVRGFDDVTVLRRALLPRRQGAHFHSSLPSPLSRSATRIHRPARTSRIGKRSAINRRTLGDIGAHPNALTPEYPLERPAASISPQRNVTQEFGGGPNTQRRVLSGLRQIQSLPSGLGAASLKGTNSPQLITQPRPVLAICSGDSQSYSPQHHSPAALR